MTDGLTANYIRVYVRGKVTGGEILPTRLTGSYKGGENVAGELA